MHDGPTPDRSTTRPDQVLGLGVFGALVVLTILEGLFDLPFLSTSLLLQSGAVAGPLGGLLAARDGRIAGAVGGFVAGLMVPLTPSVLFAGAGFLGGGGTLALLAARVLLVPGSILANGPGYALYARLRDPHAA